MCISPPVSLITVVIFVPEVKGQFKVVTFMDKSTSGRCYLHIQPYENDVDEEETKLSIRNPITSLCKSDCVRGPLSLLWWSKENLKISKTFLLSTQMKIKENLCSYQLLRHDIESERKSWTNDARPCNPYSKHCTITTGGTAHVPLPLGSQCFPSIGRIPSFGKDLFNSKSRLVDSQGVCSPDDDEVESILRVNAPLSVPHPQCPLREPQGGISIFNADVVIKEVDKNAARVFGKAILDKSYSGRTSAEEHDSYRMEGQGKLDEASHLLSTEGAHYEAKIAELNHVESRHQELLKELQLLEDQQKDLSSQLAAREHLLQEAKWEVIDLQGHIDVLNATEVMDQPQKLV
ncbi:hypothetical protein Cgig2_029914 [Carnegiea gigantea]|uniref:Uncharacterized protein n=1 Tax=Carnegiea gigantea TaxID=171969 RepID=A0A9Q1KIH4_9CARY|nr:hypothetical protein Cgig2_029914 [Carnegiea gigantea]